MAASAPDLNHILRTLIQKRIPFVLTGAHGIGGWTGRPRATHDVDILVKGGRNYTRAVNAVKALYPSLEARVFTGVTGFFLPGEKDSVIDVIYPHQPDLEETLAHPVWAEDKVLGLSYRVPSLEAALANKYGAMLNLGRDWGKRLTEVVDFRFMVKHSMDKGRVNIDLPKLGELGEKVRPGGRGQEILGLVAKVKADEPLDLNALLGRTG